MMRDEIQIAQDDEYAFPYHYIAQYRPGFSHCVSDSWAMNYASTLEFLVDRISREPVRRVLDVGCGDGRLVRALAEQLRGLELTGVDCSERAIGLARAMNIGLEFRRMDVVRERLTPASDLVLLVEVLEHVPPADAGDFLAGVARQLRAGGILYLTVPHANKPVEYKHYRHFTSALLREVLDDHFVVDELLPFEQRSRLKWLLDGLMLNRLFILNHTGMKNRIYRYYKKHLFAARDEAHCQRLFVRATVRPEALAR